LNVLLFESVNNPLYIIDFNSSFNVSVDTSGFAVACILSQTDTEGNEKPIALGSQKLTEAQAKAWPTIEKEAFAVVWALKKYRAWLFGSPQVHVYSDHNPLLFLTVSAQEFETNSMVAGSTRVQYYFSLQSGKTQLRSRFFIPIIDDNSRI